MNDQWFHHQLKKSDQYKANAVNPVMRPMPIAAQHSLLNANNTAIWNNDSCWRCPLDETPLKSSDNVPMSKLNVDFILLVIQQ